MPGKGRPDRWKRLYWRRRRGLLNILGGKCAVCGTREQLTIEHKDGRDYDIRKLSGVDRMKRYWREYNAGVRLEVRCIPHNSKDGDYWSRFYEEREAERLEKVGEWPPVPAEVSGGGAIIDEDSRV